MLPVPHLEEGTVTASDAVPAADVATDVATVRAAYDAFNRQDMPAVLTALDPDIVWQAPAELPFGGTFRGVEEVLRYFGTLADAFGSIQVDVDRVLDAGPTRVVVEGRDRFRIGGEAVEIAFAHVATMGAGRITALREYLDSGALLGHLEQSQGPVRRP